MNDQINEAAMDTLKVGGTLLAVTTVVEFIDGWGKVITWVIGLVYICIKVWNEIRKARNGNPA